MVRKVEALPSGRYKVRFRLYGKQTSETFDTAASARRFTQLLDALRDPQAALDAFDLEATQARIPTMDEIAAAHIEALTGVEPGTRVKYERMWASAWSPPLGKIPANLVTRDDIARAVNALEVTYSAKTIRNFHALLSAVLARAVEERHLPRNPAKGMRLPRAREAERVEMRILTPAELDGVLSRLNPHYVPFVRFLAGTGLRWGEAVALTVADVQLPNVRVRRALKWSPDRAAQRVAAPKTRRGNRTVAVGQALAPDLVAACAGKRSSELVWTAPQGGPISHRTFWSDIWLPAVQHLEPRPRIHDLRHTHASWLLGHGIPIHVVQVRLGHESIKTTVDTYGHLLPDAQVAAAAAMDVALGHSVPPELTRRARGL